MTLDLSRHPCFHADGRRRFGRIHLPVAPKCNLRCNFCDRRFDCVNESRPGVTSVILSPPQALAYLEQAVAHAPNLAVVGIAGPGDPFANAEATLETLRLVRNRYPDMLLCVATNGLALPEHAATLADLQVSHVTITVNAVDPGVGQHVYAWVRDGNRVYRGHDGAARLIRRQQQGVTMLKAHGLTVKINTIILPGVNDRHAAEVAKRMQSLGADLHNCVPLYPVAGTPFASLQTPSEADVARLRRESARYLPQMLHCTRCRADAVGLLGEPVEGEWTNLLRHCASLPMNPAEQRPYVAVATREGVLVNQHLGEAAELSVFRTKDGVLELVERRGTPPPGDGENRWRRMAEMLADCRAVLVASAGARPTAVLNAAGIRVVRMEGLVDEGLDAAFRGEPVRAPLRAEHRCGAGAGCAGDGTGCM